MMLSLLTGAAAFFAVIFVIGRVWDSGPLITLLAVVMVLAAGVFPWVYLLTAALWVDADSVSIRRLFITRRVPREKVRRVVGLIGRMVFVGPGDRILLTAARFLSDDQLREVAAELGVKVEGGARYLGPM